MFYLSIILCIFIMFKSEMLYAFPSFCDMPVIDNKVSLSLVVNTSFPRDMLTVCASNVFRCNWLVRYRVIYVDRMGT